MFRLSRNYARHKRPHTVWVHLNEMPRIQTLFYTDNRLRWLPVTWERGEGGLTSVMGILIGVMKMFWIELHSDLKTTELLIFWNGEFYDMWIVFLFLKRILVISISNRVEIPFAEALLQEMDSLAWESKHHLSLSNLVTRICSGPPIPSHQTAALPLKLKWSQALPWHSIFTQKTCLKKGRD